MFIFISRITYFYHHNFFPRLLLIFGHNKKLLNIIYDFNTSPSFNPFTVSNMLLVRITSTASLSSISLSIPTASSNVSWMRSLIRSKLHLECRGDNHGDVSFRDLMRCLRENISGVHVSYQLQQPRTAARLTPVNKSL
jgi:hypothetical protein